MNGSLLDYYLFVVSFLLLFEGTTSSSFFSVVGINILINNNVIKNLWKLSSTIHLSKLFEAYHVLQNNPDPKFKQLFNNMTSNVEISTTAQNNVVVAGSGLIAKQQQQQIPKGQVVALYPIHSLGYANGKYPPVVHVPTRLQQRPESYYNNNDTSSQKKKKMTTIVGTSDLICFQDEAQYFGVVVVEEEDRIDDDNNNENNEQETILVAPEIEEVEEIDYSYTMLDPSGRYVFDVNPSRSLPNDLFAAHFVNDAAAANFSSLDVDDDDEDFDDIVIDTALRYLNDSMKNFNCVMTPFGPPPLMAYVTIKPVDVGKELLASYGLDYWLGKVKDEDQIISIQKILDGSTKVQNKLKQYDNHIGSVLEEAIDTVHSSKLYKTQTKLIKDTIRNHMRKSRRRPSSSWSRQRLLSWWNKKRRRKNVDV